VGLGLGTGVVAGGRGGAGQCRDEGRVEQGWGP
jgi:hypothetical protein